MKLFSFIVKHYYPKKKLISWIFMTEKKDRIKEERKRLKLTQEKVAGLCGVHRVQWGRYERGEQGFDGEPLRKFGKAGADVAYILTGTRTPEAEMEVLGKVSKVQKGLKNNGDSEGSENIDEALQNLQDDTVKRGLNAQKRADEIRQVHLMLCDADDESFERMCLKIEEIHTGQEATEVAQTTNKVNKANQSINSGSHSNNTININEGGFTETPFQITALLFGSASWLILSCVNTFEMSQLKSLPLVVVGIMLFFLALVAFVFAEAQKTKRTNIAEVNS